MVMVAAAIPRLRLLMLYSDFAREIGFGFVQPHTRIGPAAASTLQRFERVGIWFERFNTGLVSLGYDAATTG
jgi:hypothetical protein